MVIYHGNCRLTVPGAAAIRELPRNQVMAAGGRSYRAGSGGHTRAAQEPGDGCWRPGADTLTDQRIAAAGRQRLTLAQDRHAQRRNCRKKNTNR